MAAAAPGHRARWMEEREGGLDGWMDGRGVGRRGRGAPSSSAARIGHGLPERGMAGAPGRAAPAREAGGGPPPGAEGEGLAQARRRHRHGPTQPSAWIRRGREGGGAAAPDPAELDAADGEAGGGRSLGVPVREKKGAAWGGRREGPAGKKLGAA